MLDMLWPAPTASAVMRKTWLIPRISSSTSTTEIISSTSVKARRGESDEATKRPSDGGQCAGVLSPCPLFVASCLRRFVASAIMSVHLHKRRVHANVHRRAFVGSRIVHALADDVRA